jgi:hypothetical protein
MLSHGKAARLNGPANPHHSLFLSAWMPVKKVWPRLTMSADERVEEATTVGLRQEQRGRSHEEILTRREALEASRLEKS